MIESGLGLDQTDFDLLADIEEEIQRDSALVQSLIPLSGLDESGIDALFVQAAGL